MSIEITAKALAEKVLEMDKVCDRSKLQSIELEYLKKVVELAGQVCADTNDYLPVDDQAFL